MTARSLPRLVLTLTGLGFLSFGLAYALFPLPMARLTDVQLPTHTARIDFSATYGGFELGVGTFLLGCSKRAAWSQAGLWAGSAVLSFVALVRLLLAVAGPGVTRVIWVALGIELTGAMANIFALHVGRSRPR